MPEEEIDLKGEVVEKVFRHRHGYVIKFESGKAIKFDSCGCCDGVFDEDVTGDF